MSSRPRLLIEEWLPAAAIGVECMRERETGQQPPDKRLHVWWARRPLTASRAAVLGSLLPAEFPKNEFERLLGFWGSSEEIITAQQIVNWAKNNNQKVDNPHGQRAFKNYLNEDDVVKAHEAAKSIWGDDISVIDPMAGGGSLPLESTRMGFSTIANEYNPVACSILEATVDYPFLFGEELTVKTEFWAHKLRNRFNNRVNPFYPKSGFFPPNSYIFAQSVPCPDTGYLTPLVPDWHLLKPKIGRQIVAKPKVNLREGTWSIEVSKIGEGAGQLKYPPQPTYKNGKGISLFKNNQISSDYIKAKAQAGEMISQLYTVVFKTNKGLEFRSPEKIDIDALKAAESELNKLRMKWETENVLPTESYPKITSDKRPRLYGMPKWSDMFTSRQLLCMGVLVEELKKLRVEIIKEEGEEKGEAIVHLLSFIINKFCNFNCILTRWVYGQGIIAGKMDRHDYAFKPSFAEMAPCNEGSGLDWAINNCISAYSELSRLPSYKRAKPVKIFFGSSTNLPYISEKTITAVIVDPPYADNVQYSELADFFYIWLKRTQGHRHPEWFSTYLCENDEEAVVNIYRSKKDCMSLPAEAKNEAYNFYNNKMTATFSECYRILRDDGVLTVMFTHKKQEAWDNLFNSLIFAGFTITSTWPVKTESEHSLHQAKKNAAQSTVILVARKREPDAGIGYFDSSMQKEIRDVARDTAERLKNEGLNPVDQLVGSFGPAMEVYSRYDEVRTDTGEPVEISEALNEASNAISAWRIEQLASQGLEGVEPEGQFTLLCWDVLGAQEFRFNEAKLLGNAVGMDVDQLVTVGLVSKSSDKIRILSAQERRRARALEPDEVVETLFGTEVVSRKRSRRDVLKVHPNDPQFRTTLDACHALALRYIEAEGGSAGIGSAKALALQQNWTQNSPVARLMEALLLASPEAVRHAKGKNSAAEKFPEFRAWHALLKPIFGLEHPDWTVKPEPFQEDLFTQSESKESSE